VELARALYAVERQGKELSATGRLQLRQRSSAPVLAGFKKKLVGWKEQLLPKHPMAEAASYVLGQWQELNVFCADEATTFGMLPLAWGVGSERRCSSHLRLP
jgi:hypothetical protein